MSQPTRAQLSTGPLRTSDAKRREAEDPTTRKRTRPRRPDIPRRKEEKKPGPPPRSSSSSSGPHHRRPAQAPPRPPPQDRPQTAPSGGVHDRLTKAWLASLRTPTPPRPPRDDPKGKHIPPRDPRRLGPPQDAPDGPKELFPHPPVRTSDSAEADPLPFSPQLLEEELSELEVPTWFELLDPEQEEALLGPSSPPRIGPSVLESGAKGISIEDRWTQTSRLGKASRRRRSPRKAPPPRYCIRIDRGPTATKWTQTPGPLLRKPL